MARSNAHLVGQIAVQEGLLSPEKLEECLRLQESEDPSRTLGTILVDKGFLTPAQLEAVVKIQKRRFDTLSTNPSTGGLFGQIALMSHFVNHEQLYECLREQQAAASDVSSLRLGQILLRKNYLTIDQFLEVLRRQKKEVVKCPVCDTFYSAKDRKEDVKFVCSRCQTVVQIRPPR